MQSNSKKIRGEAELSLHVSKHLLMGYLFLGLVFLGAVSSVYYWEFKAKAGGNGNVTAPKQVESGEQSPNGTVLCAQVVTQARHKQSGEIRDFPTPCHVNSDNWEIIK